MKDILYSDFENEKSIMDFFDEVFTSGENHGFIRATNFEDVNLFSKVFFDYFKSGDISIKEADYVFNKNIDEFMGCSSRWEYLEEDFSKAGKKTDLLRKNAVYLLEASEKEKYFLNLKIVDKKYLTSEAAGKFIIIGNADFFELLTIWERYNNIIDEMLFFPYPEDKNIFEIPDLQKFYRISFSKERIKRYTEYKLNGAKYASDKLEELLNSKK